MNWYVVLIASLGLAGFLTFLMACDWLVIGWMTGETDGDEERERDAERNAAARRVR